jgi:ankyrin repeat protein
LAYGADPNVPRGDGRTAFVLAVRTGNVALADFLRAHGARDEGVTRVDALLGACMRADAAEARALLDADPALIASLTNDDRGTTVQAVYDRRDASLSLMASLGFDPSWEGPWGGTPLHHAAWLGRIATVNLLLGLGAAVNVRDSRFGSSPLAWAAHGSTNCKEAGSDHCAVAASLLDAGSDRATSINRWDEPPETMATPEFQELLRSRGFAP